MEKYSRYDGCNLGVLDYDGLKNAIQEFVKIFPDKKDFYLGMLNDKYKTIGFGDWSNIKLVSYWYDEQVYFFRTIAPFLEGGVYWRFEEDCLAGYIQFEDGDVSIFRGVMNWVENKGIDMIDDTIPQMERLIALNKLKSVSGGKNG